MKLGKIDAEAGTPIGKVIKIPNEYTIIVNVGNDVLSVGDAIYIVEIGSDVIDPDTGKNLGSYDFVKAELDVDEVYPCFSVCRKINYKKEKSFLQALSPLLEEKTTKYYEDLNVNPSANEHLKLMNESVNIGDPIKLKLE